MKILMVTTGDGLSKIGQKFYGDIHKWPVIYEANRDVIGNDPNMIKAGQRLLIPTLPKVSGIKG
jgi:nucleoid-associated protein YgaU